MIRNSCRRKFVKLGIFSSLKGGAAPGELKALFLNSFYEMLDRAYVGENDYKITHRNCDMKRIAGILWNCTDIVPSHESYLISLLRGNCCRKYNSDINLTFAQASRAIMRHINAIEQHGEARAVAARVPNLVRVETGDIDLGDLLDGLF